MQSILQALHMHVIALYTLWVIIFNSWPSTLLFPPFSLSLFSSTLPPSQIPTNAHTLTYSLTSHLLLQQKYQSSTLQLHWYTQVRSRELKGGLVSMATLQEKRVLLLGSVDGHSYLTRLTVHYVGRKYMHTFMHAHNSGALECHSAHAHYSQVVTWVRTRTSPRTSQGQN